MALAAVTSLIAALAAVDPHVIRAATPAGHGGDHPVIELTAPNGTSAPANGTTELCVRAVVTGTSEQGILTVAITAGPNAGPSQSNLSPRLDLCYTSVAVGTDTIGASWVGPVLSTGEQLSAWPQQVAFEWTPADSATGGGEPEPSPTVPATESPNNPQISLAVNGPASAPADGQSQLCVEATVTGNVVSGATTLTVTSGPNAGWSMTERGWFGSCLSSATSGVDVVAATWVDNDGEVHSNTVQLEWIELPAATAPPATSPPQRIDPFVEILAAEVDCDGVVRVQWHIGAVPEPATTTEHLVLINPEASPTDVTATELVDQPVNSADFGVAIPLTAEPHRVHVIVDFEPENADGILLVEEATASVVPDC